MRSFGIQAGCCRKTASVGRVLHVIAGYREAPGALEFAAYVATIVGITFLSRKAKRASASFRQLRPAAGSRDI